MPIEIHLISAIIVNVRRGKPIKNTVDEVQTGIRVSEQRKTNSPDSLDGSPQHTMERDVFPDALAEKADGLSPAPPITARRYEL